LAKQFLDGSGNGSVLYSITSSGSSVVLTISKHNNYPYVNTLTVTGSCSLFANFYADNLNPAINHVVSFTDISSYSPTAWQWSFTPTTVRYKITLLQFRKIHKLSLMPLELMRLH